jgi:hypothetical protein
MECFSRLSCSVPTWRLSARRGVLLAFLEAEARSIGFTPEHIVEMAKTVIQRTRV